MKIRTDFVTNSSSSSFVAVFGTAINNENALKSAKDNKLERYVITGKELLEDYHTIHRENTCNDWCWVDPFPNKEEIKEDGLYFIYSDCDDVNTDEDGDISEDEVDDHYNYVREKINKLEGFTFSVDSGSGRNG